jgi:beta-lactamase superfamily II metal-dependent hydrolase
MPTCYVNAKTARLFEAASGERYEMIMIHGDEVRVTAAPDFTSDKRIDAVFRGKSGFVKQNQLKQSRDLQICFIDVGQGDATFIVTPGNKTILVDGGLNNRALGFLVWLYRLDKPGNSVDIDLLVLSHADGDHLVGLKSIVEHPAINIKRIVHSGIATFKKDAWGTTLGNLDATGSFLVTRHDRLAELDPTKLSKEFGAWRNAVIQKGCTYGCVSAADGTLDIGENDIKIEVLGPNLESTPGGDLASRWFDDEPHTINGHSVVLRLSYRDVALMLPGDVNIPGSKYLLSVPAVAARLSAQVLKAPHHGSHEYHPPFLEAVRPQVSVISSGDEPDHGHPRANFLAAVGRVSRSPEPLLFSTEIAATFVEAGDELPEEAPSDLAELDFANSKFNDFARKLFKQRLPGMINVRTDGHSLFAARRVNASYQWEAYGPHPAAPHPTLLPVVG